MADGTLKKKLLIYAHSYSRYLFAEKVHYLGLRMAKQASGMGGSDDRGDYEEKITYLRTFPFEIF